MLEVKHLTRLFPGEKGIKDCSWKIQKGRVNGLIGPNGCGKTTTLRILAGLEEKDAGIIRWDGVDLKELDNKQIGYLPEETWRFADCTLEDMMVLQGSLKGMKPSQVQSRIRVLRYSLPVDELMSKELASLSKGNRQMAALAVILVSTPMLILMDEPFSGLDVKNTQMMKRIIRDYAENHLVLLCAHEPLEDLFENGHWIRMREGRTVDGISETSIK